MGRRRTLIPASGLLTPLKRLVGSGRLKGNSKNTPERSAPPPCDAEKGDGRGDLIPDVLDGKETVVWVVPHRRRDRPDDPRPKFGLEPTARRNGGATLPVKENEHVRRPPEK